MKSIITIFIAGNFILYGNAQSYVNVSTEPSSEYGPTGRIIVEIIQADMEPNWLPPFYLEAVNTSDGQVFNTTSIGYSAKFENLTSDLYEITIYFNSTCELDFQALAGFLVSLKECTICNFMTFPAKP